MSDNIDIKEIVKKENQIYVKTDLLTEKVIDYCPGCGHGTTHR